MDLARGHVVLGEHAEAFTCLERAVREDPGAPGLLATVEELLEVWALDAERRAYRAAAEALRAQLVERLGPSGAAASAHVVSPGTPAAAPRAPEPELAVREADELDLPEAEPLSEELSGDLNLPIAAGRERPSAGALAPRRPAPLPAAPEELGALLGFAPSPSRTPGRGLVAAPEGHLDADHELVEPTDAELLRGLGGLVSRDDPPTRRAQAGASRSAAPADERVRVLERWLTNARDLRSRP
jgi:hypothetical protein